MMKTEETSVMQEMQTLSHADVQNDIEDVAAPGTISLLKQQTQFFCTMPDSGSRKDKIKIYNSINSSANKLDDNMNKELDIVDVAAHTVMLKDDEGELSECLRVILIDKDGVGYDCVAMGVVSSLQKIFAIVGMPHWDEPVRMKCIEQKTRQGFKTKVLELI